MNLAKLSQRIGNVFISGILRSPFHALLSKNTLLITCTGRKSGRRYTTPVNYVCVSDLIYVTSMKDRTWWRNLRGGARLTLRLQGQEVTGWGEVIEDVESVRSSLTAYLRTSPKIAKYFEVGIDSERQLDEKDVARASKPRVMVIVRKG